MTRTEKQRRKELFRAEIERRGRAKGPRATLSVSLFKDLLDSYFRFVWHPRIAEIGRIAPRLLDNPKISAKLFERYPSTRMSDEEYERMWTEQLVRPSFMELIKTPPEDSWKGGTLPIPLQYESKK